MNKEVKHILISLYTALVYPFSAILFVAGLFIVFGSSVYSAAIGIVMIFVAITGVVAYTVVSKRR